jgi:hypothetical protein
MDNQNTISNHTPAKSKQSNTDARALWTSQFTTIFCELYVDEVFQGNRPNIHFTKHG